MTQQHGQAVDVQTQLRRQAAQPRLIFCVGVLQSVVVTDLCKVIVFGIRVATLTVVQFVANAVVIVALHTDNVVLLQQ